MRHAHEQNIIATIEEARKETQEEFYRVLEDRERRDWDAKKRRVFEELGGRTVGDNQALADLKKSFGGKSILSVSGTRPSRYVLQEFTPRARPAPVPRRPCRRRAR